uniref:Putative acetyl-coa transporter n=1 Tax=Ixodes ricinus TaxID=34613 RepID=A0A0K8RL06_IXORI
MQLCGADYRLLPGQRGLPGPGVCGLLQPLPQGHPTERGHCHPRRVHVFLGAGVPGDHDAGGSAQARARPQPGQRGRGRARAGPGGDVQHGLTHLQATQHTDLLHLPAHLQDWLCGGGQRDWPQAARGRGAQGEPGAARHPHGARPGGAASPHQQGTTSGHSPLNVFLKAYPIRLLFGVLFMFLL